MAGGGHPLPLQASDVAGGRHADVVAPGRRCRRIGIEITGLRPGEKLHEVLLASDEVDLRPAHHLISQVPVPVPALAPTDARSIDVFGPHEGMIGDLAALAGMPHADVGHRGRDSAT